MNSILVLGLRSERQFLFQLSILWIGRQMVRRLLCSARPVSIQTSVNPSASDQDVQQLFN
ncbi:hypothetical protein CK203_016779 [Vitis vinifera]|uniref:Uncharacterized protein n=1 Tax=Vitis vinifera TaxID=29760 RepID=A0A438J2I7_VITVI|nr:hypothetical protein CK203_016779 [Vitis vinifera]